MILTALPLSERRRVMAEFDPVPLTLKQAIMDPGEPITHVYFPESGVISLTAALTPDEAVEVATIGNEGMVGLPVFLGAHTSPLRAFVQVPGDGLRMRAGVFRDLLQDASSLARILQRYTEALLNQIAQAAACNRLHTIEARCARWLLMTHDRVQEDRFPLTQEFLSQMLGVRRQGVASAAGKLQDAGAIEYTRGIISVIDREKLEAFSCPCYGVIRDDYDQLMRNPRGGGRHRSE